MIAEIVTSGPWSILNLTVALVTVRQLLVLRATLKARRFLHQQYVPSVTRNPTAPLPRFYLVIPVLREAGGLRQAVQHFEMLIQHHAASIIVVTTEREATERAEHQDAGDTAAIAAALARAGRITHLHAPDPRGAKADQVNFAVAAMFGGADGPCEHDTFFLIYDVDSRPPWNTLDCFVRAIEQNPHASVFHQSAHFELRGRPGNTAWAKLLHIMADSGALRASRYVLAYELPRLIGRSQATNPWSRLVRSWVYTHITGHGLCLRASLLREMPLPSRSPMEDMHYSFALCARNLPIVPVASLDRAEVSGSLVIQFWQLTRWFAGPARFRHYLADPQTQAGWRARMLALSAAGCTMEWLACAVAPPALGMAVWFGDVTLRTLTGGLLIIYAIQLVLTEHTFRTEGSWSQALARILAYPFTLTMFGIAGVVGAALLMRDGCVAGKTERPG